MAEGNEPNPNQVYYDYVEFNLNQCTSAFGYLLAEMQKNHTNQLLVGFTPYSVGISDISRFTFQPVLISDKMLYITYTNADTSNIPDRVIALRLLFKNA